MQTQVFTCAPRKLTGMSFTSYASNLRLDHSVTLLSHSPELSIDQISKECGFGTIRQFQRQFKTRFGVSPTDYTEEVAGEGKIED